MLISIAIDFRLADVATRERFQLSEERLVQLCRTARSEIAAARDHVVEDTPVVRADAPARRTPDWIVLTPEQFS